MASTSTEKAPSLAVTDRFYKLEQRVFDKVNRFSCSHSVKAWNDHRKEKVGVLPHEISNCWNCTRPLTLYGYFPHIADWSTLTADEKAKMAAVLPILQKQCPLPKNRFSIPVVMTSDGKVRMIGAVCSIACLNRQLETRHAYNISNVATIRTKMALDVGLDFADIKVTAPDDRCLKMYGGWVSSRDYSDVAKHTNVTAVDSDIFHLTPVHYQFQEKQSVARVESRFSAFLRKSHAESKGKALAGTVFAPPVLSTARIATPQPTAPSPTTQTTSASGKTPVTNSNAQQRPSLESFWNQK
ncbi:hypothetical protein OAM67_00050 [bacterium]|nr:hypothetical protein [bacterium]